MKKIIITILFVSISAISFAQGAYEAFRFSQDEFIGSARYVGAGGAFSATGGDFSALISNPAALGLYKRHEVSLTPIVLSFLKDNTLYHNQTTLTNNPKYTMPQCGLVIANTINNSNWRTWQFGFGCNRTMDFNNTFRAEGSGHTSFMDAVNNVANGTHYSKLSSDALIAWETYLLDTIPGTLDQYFTPFHDKDLDQSTLVKTSGGIDELTFAFGGNYNDKVFIGGSINIPILDYTEETLFTESPTNGGSLQGINSYQISTIQYEKATGVNAKLGIIYQPVPFLRLSAAIITPSYYWNIKETYSREMVSFWENAATKKYSYVNRNNYALSTPLKCNVAASFLIQKRAFISAEYELSDYAMSSLSANNYSFTDENNEINNQFGICHKVRIGGEVNLTPKFILRAGYNFKSSPLKSTLSNSEYNGLAHYGSVGFGIRTKFIFFDLAYVLKYAKDAYTLYPFDYTMPAFNTTAYIQNTTHRVVATIGCKF